MARPSHPSGRVGLARHCWRSPGLGRTLQRGNDMAKAICSIDECDRTVLSRGWCSVHYGRWTRHGDPLTVLPLGRPLAEGSVLHRYPVHDKVCDVCGGAFRARHGRRCRSCTYEASRQLCACGKPIGPKSTTCRTCRPRSFGSNNPHWRGGRFISNGYAFAHAPGHPRARRLYVPEHVLVMERLIGRYLVPSETVHHKNGVRDDNRESNLELWATGQPSGQRAVDLLAWAREIVDRYEHVEALLVAPDETVTAEVPGDGE